VTLSTFVPPAVEGLRPFVEAGVLGPTELHAVASYVAAAAAEGHEVPSSVVLACALAVRAPLHGHVCVDLRTIRSVVVGDDESPTELSGKEPAPTDQPEDPLQREQQLLDALEWPQGDAWTAAVAVSPLVQVVGRPRTSPELLPFVLEGELIYLARYWVMERYVAADLRHRSERADADAAESDAHADRVAAMDVARAKVGELFPAVAGADSSQRDAVDAALDRDFVVVSGGPGTGKTYTVARLLAAVMSGLEGVDSDLQVALVAPTGKASARMSEAIRQSIEPMASGDPFRVSDQVRARLAALEATTIHRLLGRKPDGGFRHGPDSPLPHDIVVVDEVSMVSLSLMAHLLAAIRPTAKVVLVGDPFQLASVEAGAVLGDIVGLAAPGAADLGANRIRSSIRQLGVVHRQSEGSPILDLATAIRDDQADDVMSILRAGVPEVSWIDPDDTVARRRVEAMVAAQAKAAVTAAAAAAACADRGERGARALEALAAINDLKVLSALRRGSDGVDGWNRRTDDRLRAEDLIGWDDWYSGRPVMVTKNDYMNHVFNGDVGIAVAAGDRFQVWFPRSPDPLVVEASRLGNYMTQWAMSIHKSQGSEFGHVVITLPPPPSRILTRELLYTAVTRAKKEVTIVASEDAIRFAVERPVARASGLAARLADG
jgi:exodeoxyribonuclease V alpha subunit